MYRIRTRLLIAILLAALLPAVPMTLVVGNLLERSLNPGLHGELTEGLEAGLAVSRESLARIKAEFLVDAERAAQQKPRPSPRSTSPRLVQLAQDGQPMPPTIEANRLDSRSGLNENPRLIDGHIAVQILGYGGLPVIIAQRLPDGAEKRVGEITEAMSLLAAFQFERESILRSYVLPFLLVYAVLILVALIVAVAVSNRLARPLEEVAQAASDVADGELEIRVASRARGEVGDLVEAFNDMVARLQEQRGELARLEKLSAWRDMSRVLAHEIKNPLTPILLAVQQARSSYHGPDESHAEILAECETIVAEEVEGLRGLVRSFSDFARPPQPELKPEEIADLFEGLARLYGERLETNFDVQARSWILDAAQIKRVVINLIDNGLFACEQSGRNPKVRIDAKDTGSWLRVEVRDEGGGIAPENLPRIFEPDFTTSTQGMGLGLPIASGIVQAHGGTLRVESDIPNGSCFTILLPWIESEERA